jgi:peptidase E
MAVGVVHRPSGLPSVGGMPASAPTILATSMGFGSRGRGPYDLVPGPVFDLAFELAGAPERPRLCYLGTATGDDPARIAGVYGAFAVSDVRVSHLSLFTMPTVPDLRAHLLGQDVVWVGGGSVANLLAVWRVHGLDDVLREAWQAGVVLGGTSAGSLCWHVGGTTDSFGPELRPVTDGLAFIPASNGVHYDSEELRRPLYHRLVADGTLPAGHATDDGVGLVYRGTELADVVADKPGKAAYRVERGPDGDVRETRLEPRLLR